MSDEARDALIALMDDRFAKVFAPQIAGLTQIVAAHEAVFATLMTELARKHLLPSDEAILSLKRLFEALDRTGQISPYGQTLQRLIERIDPAVMQSVHQFPQ